MGAKGKLVRSILSPALSPIAMEKRGVCL